jgi:hypothetical protein
MMVTGDLVHIPQGSLLLAPDTEMRSLGNNSYLRVDKPIKAIFLNFNMKEPNWGSIYYKEKAWDVRIKDIYPITKEVKDAC